MDEFPILELEESVFPPLLHEIPDPPKRLYLKGAPALWDGRAILTVVGSRSFTSYGKEVTRSLISGLAGYPILIVSGLALGTDTHAHEAALEAGLPTLAVPGSGLDEQVLYPRRNLALSRKILNAGGALLSEYAPTARAALWSFPQRNRIMAGMSHAVLIIEASQKSGTLITARLGMEYNREVLMVPGSIFSQNSYGPHLFIRNGATPITSAADILEALHIDQKPAHPKAIDATEDEMAILSLLSEPLPKDEIIRRSTKQVFETNMILSLLELKGYISDHNGIMVRIVDI